MPSNTQKGTEAASQAPLAPPAPPPASPPPASPPPAAPAAEDTRPKERAFSGAALQSASIGSVMTAEEREAAARDREERQRQASLGLGAHAVDEDGAKALELPTNTARASNVLTAEGERPGNAGSGLESAVPPREVEAGFVRNGVDIFAHGPTAKMLPLQHEAPPVDEFPKAVTNQPFGSEPGLVDSSTGERRFQPKRREHLLGAGLPPGETADKEVVEQPDET